MKIFTSFITLLFLCLTYGYGQVDDPRSKKIIDDMTAKFKTYPSLSLDFSVTISEIEQEGKLWLKNNLYKLELPDHVISFDGSKIYSHQISVKEVYLSKPDPDEDDKTFQLLNPQSYFNISSKSFTSNLVKESTMNNRKVYEIDLYPIQLKTTNFSRIRIMVERSTFQLVYLKVFMTDGIQYAITFKPYEKLEHLRDSFFSFNRLQYPNVEVIDLTF
jgi:outer membrane lipoprotein-sorting protein